MAAVAGAGRMAAVLLLTMCAASCWTGPGEPSSAPSGSGALLGGGAGGGLVVFAEGSSDGDGGEVLAYPAKVTCGSVVKIVNKNSHLHLRSQEISYGSGSGLQAVTALENAEEAFNFWVRRAPPLPHFLPLSLSLTDSDGEVRRARDIAVHLLRQQGRHAAAAR